MGQFSLCAVKTWSAAWARTREGEQIQNSQPAAGQICTLKVGHRVLVNLMHKYRPSSDDEPLCP